MGKSLASPTESMIKEVSASFSEPQELSRERFVALDYFNKLPLEKSVLYTKYVDILSGLTLDSFEPGLPSTLRSSTRKSTGPWRKTESYFQASTQPSPTTQN